MPSSKPKHRGLQIHSPSPCLHMFTYAESMNTNDAGRYQFVLWFAVCACLERRLSKMKFTGTVTRLGSDCLF
jgi:hypothetical protein